MTQVDFYDKEQSDALLSAKADKSTTYTKTEVDTALGAKANSADVYTKSEADTLLGSKANSADVYTKSEIDTSLGLKADKSVAIKKESGASLDKNTYFSQEFISSLKAGDILIADVIIDANNKTTNSVFIVNFDATSSANFTGFMTLINNGVITPVNAYVTLSTTALSIYSGGGLVRSFANSDVTAVTGTIIKYRTIS